jgi:hypothetical protein
VSTPTAVPATTTGSSRWSSDRIVRLVVGSLLVLVSVVLLGAGGTALWADRTQRDDGYVTTGKHEFSTAGSALSTVSTELGSAGFGWLYAPSVLGKVRIGVTPENPGAPLFVGIGRTTDVDRYLAGVNHSVITDFWSEEVEPVSGGTRASAPAKQDFWVASSTGPGARTVKWDPKDGSWTVVVMNADGRPGIDVKTHLGARMPAVLWIAIGLLAAGAAFMAGGVLLIRGATRREEA